MPFKISAFCRFLVISIIFSLNIFNLIHLVFRRQTRQCVHSAAYGLVLILINSYLSIWIPYLFSSFYHGTVWPMLELNTHCSIQHLVTIQVSTLMLAILCFQKLFETFTTSRAKWISLIVFFTWIFPQTIYSILSGMMTMSDSNNNVYFLNGAVEQKSPSVMPGHEDNNKSSIINQGVLLCIHKLDSSVINQMSWHYVVLVIPLTSMFIICAGAKRFAKTSSLDIRANLNCECNYDVVMLVCLYVNFIWLLFMRPLLSLFALLRVNSTNIYDDVYQLPSIESIPLDLGSHLILILISILLPFSKSFGLPSFLNHTPANKLSHPSNLYLSYM